MRLHTMHKDNFSYYNTRRSSTVWFILKHEILVVEFKTPSNKRNDCLLCRSQNHTQAKTATTA